MVEVVWRKQRRRMQLEPKWPSRMKAKVAGASDEQATPGAAADAGRCVPVEVSSPGKMLRYLAVSIAEREGIPTVEAVAKARAVLQADEDRKRAANGRRRKKPKLRKQAAAPSPAAVAHSARPAGKSTTKARKKVKKKKKPQSYPFFLFLRGGAPGMGRRR